MAFNFSQTAGTSGYTSIVLSADSRQELTNLVENFTLANASGSSLLMPVVQTAYEPTEKYLNFNPSAITWDAGSNTGTLSIQSNDDWVITSNGWIDISRQYQATRGDLIEERVNVLSGNGNTIVGLYCGQNTGSARTGFISGHCISNTAVTANTTVSQAGDYVKPYLTLGSYSASISYNASSYSFSVSSNTTWNVMCDARFVTLNTLSGTNNGSVSFSVTANDTEYDRYATITVFNVELDIYCEFDLTQMAEAQKPYIKLSPEKFSVPSNGSTGNVISVSANCDYLITADVNWITLSAASGSGNGSVSFTTSENQSKFEDVGNITFTNSGVSSYVTVERKSIGNYLSANTSSLTASIDGDTLSVNVYSNVAWAVSVDSGEDHSRWLSVVPTSGSNNVELRITVASGTIARSGSVLLYNSKYGLSWTIGIEQINGKVAYYSLNNSLYPTGVADPADYFFTYGDASVVKHEYDQNKMEGYWVFDKNLTTITRVDHNRSGIKKNIIYPDTVTTFTDKQSGPGNQYNNYYTNLIIPKETTYIGDYVFGPGNNISSYPTTAFTMNKKVVTIGDNAFAGRQMTNLELELPDTLTSIGEFAFDQCYLGGSLVIPSGVTAIPQYCFDFNNFTAITIGDNVTTIGDYAFAYCSACTRLTIGRSVNSIEHYAFEYCTNLTSVYFYPATAPTYGGGVFEGSGPGTVHYPAGSDYSTWQERMPGWTFIADL